MSERGTFTFEHRSPGVVWSEEAAAGMVGTVVPVSISELRDMGAESETGEVTACEVVRDGAALRITVAVLGELATLVNALTYQQPSAVSIQKRAPAERPGCTCDVPGARVGETGWDLRCPWHGLPEDEFDLDDEA